MKRKHITAIDLILVVGTLIVLVGGGFFYSSSRPVLLSPADDLVSRGPVLFEFEKANVILIDDNLEFTSPQKIYAENNLVFSLKPGVYYWKVEGTRSSIVRMLTIEDVVDLKLVELEDGYEVVNAGNVELDVDIYEGGRFKEKIILGVGESEEVSGTKFIGGESG